MASEDAECPLAQRWFVSLVRAIRPSAIGQPPALIRRSVIHAGLRQTSKGEGAQVAHGQRHERLQAIQQELSQLAGLGKKVRSIEEMKEQHRARLHVVKKVS
jgi:hypothetical protein